MTDLSAFLNSCQASENPPLTPPTKNKPLSQAYHIVLVCQGWSPDHCPPEQLQQFAVSGLQRVESSVIDEINYDV